MPIAFKHIKNNDILICSVAISAKLQTKNNRVYKFVISMEDSFCHSEAKPPPSVILRAGSREEAEGVLSGLRLPQSKLSQRQAPTSVRSRCATVDGLRRHSSSLCHPERNEVESKDLPDE